ncbi:ArsR/SmtB family transcription factor [Vibrio sp. 10N.286.49.B1]|uniref:ArsR/SmtB family transcription factor n=1 Tax=unclassified Vibrio TaxID=2614977 RepID=UPI000C865E06|nr:MULTISPECIES: winged helix-turn-helix domain-containing protein [unclassified Vibrio]
MTSTCQPSLQTDFTPSPEREKDEHTFAAMCKALSHPARIRIISILSLLEKSGGCLNSDLVSQLGLAQSTVSEHLRILRLAGFITAEPIPPKMCYRINRESFALYESMSQDILN